MKKRFFVDWRFPAGVAGILGIGIAYAFCLYMFRYCIQGYIAQTIPPALFLGVCFMYLLMTLGIVWFFRFLGQRAMPLLIVNEKRILWIALFHLPVCMKIEDCNYIGVADMSAHNRGLPVIRGYEESYIYFSAQPLSHQYQHKIDSAKSKKGFIKFAYSEKLYQTTMAIFPSQKTNMLQGAKRFFLTQERMAKTKIKKRK